MEAVVSTDHRRPPPYDATPPPEHYDRWSEAKGVIPAYRQQRQPSHLRLEHQKDRHRARRAITSKTFGDAMKTLGLGRPYKPSDRVMAHSTG